MKKDNIREFDENDLKGYEYETLMNALHVSVFKCLLNDEFTAIWCNNYFFESTGYTKEEYISIYHYSIGNYFSCMPDEYEKIKQIVMDTLQKGLPGFECVSRMPRKDGSFIWIKVVGTFTKEQYDGIPVLYVVYTDITDVIQQQELSRRLEERSTMLRKALDEAEQANNAKSDFLSRMSHDIRTPLNAIIGMSEIAEANVHDPEKIHDCHKKIQLSSQHLLGLVNDVLDMSKIDSGKMTLNNTTVSLPELLNNVVNIIQPDMKAKEQSFKVHAYNLECETICTDALRLRQIFLNILSNACKFTPHGGRIVFDICEVKQQEDIVWMEFSFSDTGIGIRPEFLDHIFDTFTRERDSRVDKTMGSGLGMAITKKIVGILGGTIRVSSEVGVGTTFIVTLPLKKERGIIFTLPEEAANLALLFIDDDPMYCQCAERIFQDLGCHVDCFSDVQEAQVQWIDAYQAGHAYDVVILDWHLRALLQQPQIQKVLSDRIHRTVLLATAYAWEDITLEVESFGIAGCLSKPFFRSTLCEELQTCVFHKETCQSGQNKEKLYDFRGKRFLLAEDNALNREIAIALLSASGAVIEYACDGKQCVEMFEKAPLNYYDLILMDIQMPRMNGYMAAQTIRALPRADAQSIQIWAMTADAFVEDVEKAKAVGMNGHFAKPLDMQTINYELSRFLL